jgi:hypothetical protein
LANLNAIEILNIERGVTVSENVWGGTYQKYDWSVGNLFGSTRVNYHYDGHDGDDIT